MYQRDYNNIRRHVANLRYEQACDKHPVLNFIAVASMIATVVLSIMVIVIEIKTYGVAGLVDKNVLFHIWQTSPKVAVALIASTVTCYFTSNLISELA